jgi:hypothetical protein
MSNGGTYDETYDLWWGEDIEDMGCLEEDILNILSDVVDGYREIEGENYQVTITSVCREGDPGKHGEGLAIDVRTIDLTGGGYGENAEDIADALESGLGDDFYVDLHCGTCWHIHIQYDPPPN